MKLRLCSILLVLCILMSLTTNVSAATAPEDSFLGGMTEYEGHYYKVYDLGMKWTEAKTYCENLGGHLVTITSAEEQSVIENLMEFGSKNQYWIGMYRNDGELVWVTGETIDYTNWDYGQPDRVHYNGRYEDYVEIFNIPSTAYRSQRFKWNDMYVDNYNHPNPDQLFTTVTVGFICEWEDNYFSLTEDTNSFSHAGMVYELENEEYLNALIEGISGENWSPWSMAYRWRIKDRLNDPDPHGYCHGLAVSMCLGSQGLIDYQKLQEWATCYNDLLPPNLSDENTNVQAFRDMIIYYALTQNTNAGAYTRRVTREKMDRDDLEGFLSSFVAEAQRSQKEEKPFVFSFYQYIYDQNGKKVKKDGAYETSGHSVVVCGYWFNSTENCHMIRIYDPNARLTYCMMKVSRDFSQFCFTDSNGLYNYAQGYPVYALEDTWYQLRYYGINTIYNDLIQVYPSAETHSSSERAAEATAICVDCQSIFTITNAEGESLTYTGESFSGDMGSAEITLEGFEDEPYWSISTENSDYFMVEASDGCEIVFSLGGYEYAMVLDKADTVIASKDALTIQGTDVHYTVTLAPKISEAELTEISGVCSGETSFSYTEDKSTVHVESTGVMEDTAVTQYTLFQPESVSVPNSESYDIVENTDGEAIVIAQEKEYPIEKENPFTDVPEGSFYYEPVLWAVDEGVTTGATETAFNPGGDCLRAHVVTFLWRAAGAPAPAVTENPFVDVEPGSFFEKAVLWAVEEGITTGTDANHFSPGLTCNRATVVTFLYRAFGEPAVESSGNPFQDVPNDGWYTAPILWAVEQNITNGVSADSFAPDQNCSRAQIVTFLFRAYVN